MILIFDEEYMPSQAILDKFTIASEECLKAVGVDPDNVEISISFVSAEEIMELNTHYRQIERTTDVLSFPQYENLEQIKSESGQALVIGDVVIAPDIAFVQAEEYGHPVERELVYLLVHSVFHLLGFDHTEEEDQQNMRRLEEAVMEKVGLVR